MNDKKVMIVEDEPYIVESLEFILTRDGFTVVSHGDGGTALSKIVDAAPDILILDAMLPGKTGFDLLREIRSTDSVQGLPVLMLTAKGQKRDLEVAVESGANEFMTKPFSNSAVVDAVRRLANV
ncbi:MAG: response regulator [Alphaproteobacteria bacterium]